MNEEKPQDLAGAQFAAHQHLLTVKAQAAIIASQAGEITALTEANKLLAAQVAVPVVGSIGDDEKFKRLAVAWFHNNMPGGFEKLVAHLDSRTAKVSACAADAPSEPSELVLRLRNIVAEDVTPYFCVNVPKDLLRSAADALDSQPARPSPADAPPLEFRTLLEQCMVVLADAGWRSSPPIAGLRNLYEQIEKALTMEALDSQPTGPEREIERITRQIDKELSDLDDLDESKINPETLALAKQVVASSQPTDVEVRNG